LIMVTCVGRIESLPMKTSLSTYTLMVAYQKMPTKLYASFWFFNRRSWACLTLGVLKLNC